ncbi:MAG TPA: RidA family protein [Xanthomonadales bacterium]|nr:RidA family protein [Xanthomonadales bacterium]
MSDDVISTPNAPSAIGTYSQARRHGNTVYLSGQIPLDPASMEVIEGGVEDQIHRVFQNLKAVCEAAGSTLNGIVKMNVYLDDMGHFTKVNTIIAEYFAQPYPARAAVAVAGLPRGVQIEIDAVLGL